ncbi:hypothetical protein [Psychrobacter sp. Ps4]|nr:hypothetical protein [Psychrobacter sp. Ps4]
MAIYHLSTKPVSRSSGRPPLRLLLIVPVLLSKMNAQAKNTTTPKEAV